MVNDAMLNMLRRELTIARKLQDELFERQGASADAHIQQGVCDGLELAITLLENYED